jgi:voltage-gated potassium channel
VTGGADLQYEEIVVTDASGQSGKTIRDLRIRHETGAVIVALRKKDGTFDATPDPDAVLESGDVMIAAGSADELRLLEELFAPREPVAR